MKTSTSHSRESYLGAGLAFVAYLFAGLVPSLVYGGYMGLMLSGVLFGHDASENMASRFVVGGGMILGCVATLFLFLVLGAFVGNMVGAALRRAVPAEASPTDAVPVREDHTN